MSLYLSDPYYFSTLIASLVFLLQIAVALTLLALLFCRQQCRGWLRWLADRSTLLALIVVVVAVGSSLTYSDYFDMAPCKLCWFQRIFIFPQVLLLGIAWWKKQHDFIATYVMALACFAIPISVFHYLLQMTDAPAVHSFAPCDVTGQAPSCSGYYVIMYDYITIPMMALTTSATLLLLMAIRKWVR